MQGGAASGFPLLEELDVSCVQERMQFQFIEDNTHMADEALAALLRGTTALQRLGMQTASYWLFGCGGVDK